MLKNIILSKTKKPRINRGFFTGAVGIEPTSTVLETAVLPLNYAPILVELTNECYCSMENVIRQVNCIKKRNNWYY